MKKMLLIFGIFLLIILLLFFINRNYEERKQSERLKELQDELADIKRQRNDAISKAGKDIEKIIIIDEFYTEVIKKKERELTPYEKKEEGSSKEYFGGHEFTR